MNDLIAAILISIGLLFDLFGVIGLIRMPDVYCRLQAATKCTTLGTCSILLGVLVQSGTAPAAIRALVCIFFIMLTTPTAAHALARAAHKFGIPVDKHAVVDRYEDEVDQHDKADRQEEGEPL